MFILPRGHFDPKQSTSAEYDWRFRVNLHIHRPVRLETLFSLLRYPIKWECLSPSERHPITAIDNIALESGGALGGAIPRQNSDIRNAASELRIDARTCAQHEKLEESLEEVVAWLAPTSRGPEFARPLFGLAVRSGYDLEVCLRTVSSAFAVEARMTYNSSFHVFPDSSRQS